MHRSGTVEARLLALHRDGGTTLGSISRCRGFYLGRRLRSVAPFHYGQCRMRLLRGQALCCCAAYHGICKVSSGYTFLSHHIPALGLVASSPHFSLLLPSSDFNITISLRQIQDGIHHEVAYRHLNARAAPSHALPDTTNTLVVIDCHREPQGELAQLHCGPSRLQV